MQHMKKLHIILATLVLSLAANATGYDYLNFVKTDASGSSYMADGIKITFNGTTAMVTTASGTSAVPMTGISYLEFSNTKLTDSPTPAIKGDVTGDGVIDIADVNALINVILGVVPADTYEGRARINEDDVVDIADVNALINIILGTE